MYDAAFYDQAIQWQGPAAFSVANTIVEAYRPRSIIDVGCGPGTYLVQFRLLRVEVFGVEGSTDALARCREQAVPVVAADLRKPFTATRRYDLAVCFEVAEHLPKTAARGLVRTLVGCSDRIVFTAARPGQGGVGHVNEQPVTYWDRLFATRGYALDRQTTRRLKAQYRQIQHVNPWLLTNTRCYRTRRAAVRPGRA